MFCMNGGDGQEKLKTKKKKNKNKETQYLYVYTDMHNMIDMYLDRSLDDEWKYLGKIKLKVEK